MYDLASVSFQQNDNNNNITAVKLSYVCRSDYVQVGVESSRPSSRRDEAYTALYIILRARAAHSRATLCTHAVDSSSSNLSLMCAVGEFFDDCTKEMASQ